MGKAKAEKFQKLGEAEGWTLKEIIEESDINRWTISLVRGDELITCWWDNNSMLESPIYRIGAYENRPRNLAAAVRQLGLKPDLSKAYKKAKKVAKQEPGADGVAIPVIRHKLPFDIDKDPDKVILRELRGSRITYLNSYTGAAEVAAIPKAKNMDLQNVFFLDEGSNGRAFVSFMDELGMFRAVHLDAILQVS